MSKHNQFPTWEQVERIRQQYPKGTRLELIAMDDPYTTLQAGDCGTVDFVDDAGQISMVWDSGSRLSLIPGIDSFRKVRTITGSADDVE